MKQVFKILSLALVFACLMLTACSNPAGEEELITVIINLGGGTARSVGWASDSLNHGDLEHFVTLTNTGSSDVVTATVNEANGTTPATATATITAGNWRTDVTAKLTPTGATALSRPVDSIYALGTDTRPINASTGSITVDMKRPVVITEDNHDGNDIGKVYINTVLRADTSAFTGVPGTLSYQWRRGGADIGMDPTYIVKDTDVGGSITVEVTYSDGSLISAPTATVEDKIGIYNLAQLAAIDTDYTTRGGSYILLVDLDLINYSGIWTPICNEYDQFRGTFDGNGKTINLGTNKVGTVGVSVNSHAGLDRKSVV